MKFSPALFTLNKRLWLLFASLVFVTSVMGQFPVQKRERRLTKQAQELFSEQKYIKAIDKYKEIISRYDGNPDIWYNMAVCYQEINQPERAQLYYNRILKNDDQANPIVHLALGKVLMMQGNYEEARKHFLQYNELLEYNDQLAMRYISSIENIDRYFSDSTFFEEESLALNSPASDFGASTLDNSFYFLSTRDRKSDYSERYTSDLYKVPANSVDKDMDPQKVKGPANTRFGEVGYAVVPKRNEIYICRFQPGKQDQYSLGYSLYKAYIGRNNDISRPEQVVVDKFKFAIAYPTLSSSGQKIVFSSDAPGGFGGWDLYQADYTAQGFENIENLGNKVNSAGDELYAFLLNDSILFFATDGHGGLGGFDIYSKNLKEQEDYARNMGFPVNSPANDFAIYFDSGLSGYFTSNREGGKGSDDIYQFSIHQLKLSSEIVDQNNGDNLKNVNISVTRSKGSDEILALADNGRLILAAEPGETLTITVEKEGYETKSFEVNTSGMTFIGNHSVQLGKFEVLKLEPEIEAITYQLDSTLIEKAEARDDIFFATQVVSSRNKLSNATVSRYYSGSKEIVEHFDGKYYRYLIGKFPSYFEAKEVYKKEPADKKIMVAFINGKNTRVMKALKEAHVVPAEAKDPEVHAFIDRTDQLYSSLVFYGLDKFRIPRGMEVKLQSVVDSLEANPDYFLEIATHTDKRGSDMYNRALSEERARFLREYFEKKGIDKLRIISHGIGESQLKKYCTDCTEADHEQNRRGEMIIRVEKNR
jgi:outer membrane protein OmpA-like peptidoglycan-associated protein/tetratricopeptide (TPR) repeat protein